MAQLGQTRATDLHGHREHARVLQLEARDDGDHSRGVVLSTALGHCQLFAAVQYFIEIPDRKEKQRGRSARRPHLLGRISGKQGCFLVPIKDFSETLLSTECLVLHAQMAVPVSREFHHYSHRTSPAMGPTATTSPQSHLPAGNRAQIPSDAEILPGI